MHPIERKLLCDALVSALALCLIIGGLLHAVASLSAPISPLEQCAERFMTLDPDTRSRLVYGCAAPAHVHYLAGERWCRSVGPHRGLNLIEQVSHER